METNNNRQSGLCEQQPRETTERERERVIEHAIERERGRHATYRNLDVGREEAVWRSRHRVRSEEEVGRFFCFVVCRVLLIEQL